MDLDDELLSYKPSVSLTYVGFLRLQPVGEENLETSPNCELDIGEEKVGLSRGYQLLVMNGDGKYDVERVTVNSKGFWNQGTISQRNLPSEKIEFK